MASELEKSISRRSSNATLAQYISNNSPKIERALGKAMDLQQFIETVYTQLRTIPHLSECSTASIFGGALLAAQTGLSLNPVQGHAYLVPFNNKDTGFQAQFILGYRGVSHLAWASGRIRDIQAGTVHENDTFIYERGMKPVLRHIPNFKDPGDVVLFYCLVNFIGGGHAASVLTKEEVDMKHKKFSRAKSGPWFTHYEEMAQKSCLLSMKGYLPLSHVGAVAIAADETVASLGDDDTVVTQEVIDEAPEN